MLLSAWLRRFVCSPSFASPRSRTRHKVTRSHECRASLAPTAESLEHRLLLAADFGDAPDTGSGTGNGNYNTLSTDMGPQHTIVAGLFIGTGVDMEVEALQSNAANGDDLDETPSNRFDDEDGLSNPLEDATVGEGETPSVRVIVTNTTGSAATLFGWIDYDQDGQFETATEGAQISVPDGTSAGVVTLQFPTVPDVIGGIVLPTFARFRLSTDVAAANPTGAAIDGEVEDHQFFITQNSGGGIVNNGGIVRISDQTNGGPDLASGDKFGAAVASIGDLNGDGIPDLVVGAPDSNINGSRSGTVYILLLKADGTVDSVVPIPNTIGPTPSSDRFGQSIASIGDLNGDGVNDLAVGADTDSSSGSNRGAVHIVFMNANGTIQSSTRIASDTSGGPTLFDSELFGSGVAAVGDLDGDGIIDLAVGARSSITFGDTARGRVFILFMNADGTVRESVAIANNTNGGPALAQGGRFGSSVASIGDFDGDGVRDIAVGQENSNAIFVILLNSDGTAKSSVRIRENVNGGPQLGQGALTSFGSSIVSLGDLDGDGVTDLAVGAEFDASDEPNGGTVYLIFMNPDGTAKSTARISPGNDGPAIGDSDKFGSALAVVADPSGNGAIQLIVGAENDASGGFQGAIYILPISPPTFSTDFGDAPDTGTGTGTGNYNTLSSDNGPVHTVTAGLFLGSSLCGARIMRRFLQRGSCFLRKVAVRRDRRPSELPRRWRSNCGSAGSCVV